MNIIDFNTSNFAPFSQSLQFLSHPSQSSYCSNLNKSLYPQIKLMFQRVSNELLLCLRNINSVFHSYGVNFDSIQFHPVLIRIITPYQLLTSFGIRDLQDLLDNRYFYKPENLQSTLNRKPIQKNLINPFSVDCPNQWRNTNKKNQQKRININQNFIRQPLFHPQTQFANCVVSKRDLRQSRELTGLQVQDFQSKPTARDQSSNNTNISTKESKSQNYKKSYKHQNLEQKVPKILSQEEQQIIRQLKNNDISFLIEINNVNNNGGRPILETQQEIALQKYIIQEFKMGKRLSLRQISQKAKEISYSNKQCSTFLASNGWLSNFMRRYPKMKSLFNLSRNNFSYRKNILQDVDKDRINMEKTLASNIKFNQFNKTARKQLSKCDQQDSSGELQYQQIHSKVDRKMIQKPQTNRWEKINPEPQLQVQSQSQNQENQVHSRSSQSYQLIQRPRPVYQAVQQKNQNQRVRKISDENLEYEKSSQRKNRRKMKGEKQMGQDTQLHEEHFEQCQKGIGQSTIKINGRNSSYSDQAGDQTHQIQSQQEIKIQKFQYLCEEQPSLQQEYEESSYDSQGRKKRRRRKKKKNVYYCQDDQTVKW